MKYFYIFLLSIICFSCTSSSELKKEFPCDTSISFQSLKEVNDIRSLFTISLPKTWKVNLYYDNSLSSIYAADTTLNLTKTMLLDASIIHTSINLDKTFKEKITNDNKRMELEELKTKNIQLFDKPTYYSLAKGKKGKFTYHILNVFTKVNSDNFMHIKTEIYGDSLVNDRLCNAINLIEKIQVK